MGRRGRIVVGVVVVVLVLIGAGAWWFLRDDPPEELSVEDVADGEAGPIDDASDGADGGLDGTWTIAEGDESQAGLRIDESFVGGIADHTAVGRTAEVTGSVEIEGTTLAAAVFTVDLTVLEWSDAPGFPTDNRSVAMRDQGLETATFPEAAFELTGPVEVDALPTGAAPVSAEITGDLTLHGVTKATTFAVEIARDGERLVVATAEPVPVVLADHDIEEPSTPSIAGVADEGTFEFLVVLVPEGPS